MDSFLAVLKTPENVRKETFSDVFTDYGSGNLGRKAVNCFMAETVISKPMYWFLYDNGLRHERFN